MRLGSFALPRGATSPRVRVAHLVTDEELAALSAHLLLVAPAERGAVDARLWVVGRGDTEARLPAVRIATGPAGAVRQLAGTLRRERIAVLHSHTARTDVIAALAAGGVRRVSTQWQPGVRSAVHRWALRRFDRIHVPTGAALRALLDAGVRGQRLRRILPPVDAARFAAAYRRRARPGRPGTGLITCFSPLVASPALLAVLHAFAAARLPGTARLVVAGDGPQERTLATWRIRLGLEQRMHLRPAPADPLPLLRASDVVVLPPAGPALPTTALAACAAGVPVVALDAPGVRELITDGVTGFRPAPGDRDALVRALETACRGGDSVAHLVRRARRRVERSFAPGRYAARLVREYRTLVAPAPRAGARVVRLQPPSASGPSAPLSALSSGASSRL
jgi:glycosyltransferase involved in cell wall biosynthesis